MASKMQRNIRLPLLMLRQWMTPVRSQPPAACEALRLFRVGAERTWRPTLLAASSTVLKMLMTRFRMVTDTSMLSQLSVTIFLVLSRFTEPKAPQMRKMIFKPSTNRLRAIAATRLPRQPVGMRRNDLGGVRREEAEEAFRS